MLTQIGLYGAAYGIIADITTVVERGFYVGSLILLSVTMIPLLTCPVSGLMNIYLVVPTLLLAPALLSPVYLPRSSVGDGSFGFWPS